MDRIDFFSTAPAMHGFQGSTFPAFCVCPSGIDLDGCTMRMVLEDKRTPGQYVLKRNCTLTQDEHERDIFQVQLTTTDTQYLCGSYNIYFILRDTDNHDFKNLVGTLEVLPSPEEDE